LLIDTSISSHYYAQANAHLAFIGCLNYHRNFQIWNVGLQNKYFLVFHSQSRNEVFNILSPRSFIGILLKRIFIKFEGKSLSPWFVEFLPRFKSENTDDLNTYSDSHGPRIDGTTLSFNITIVNRNETSKILITIIAINIKS